MKQIFRMVIFSAVAVYITSLWNKGFIVDYNWYIFAKATIIVSLIYYFIAPLIRVILLPLNILTLGLVSFLAYLLVFYILIEYFSVIKITSWIFPGFSWNGISINKMEIGYFTNLILSSLSVSLIINLLESLI